MTNKSISVVSAIVGLTCAVTLVASLAAAQAGGDAARGEKQFEECASCHSIKAGEHGVGPTLHLVFNRQAASFEDFRYSPAMRKSGITWTATTLDTFIADPQMVVPANRMAYSGLMDASARADLIAYLQKATQ